ncbi:MAG: hypothetical protein PHN88_08045 [Ignavibacteria bacterium]|nr:hypothetical protein [Ignavibacteria bacterium]
MTETIKTGIIAVRRKLPEVSGQALTGNKNEKEYSIMKTIKILFNICICLFIVLSFLQCSVKPTSKCGPVKIQLLLEDLFKKDTYFYACKVKILNLNHKIPTPPDSSKYFCYLISRDLKIPDKEFYLHWDKELAPTYPDSIKLKVIKDISEMHACTFEVGISMIEVNEDTTKVKVELGYGFGKTSWRECTFTYLFNDTNCKWVALDSSITFQY